MPESDELDPFDKRILNQLVADTRLSVTTLADRIARFANIDLHGHGSGQGRVTAKRPIYALVSCPTTSADG